MAAMLVHQLSAVGFALFPHVNSLFFFFPKGLRIAGNQLDEKRSIGIISLKHSCFTSPPTFIDTR